MKAPFPRFRIRELSHLQMQTSIARMVYLISPIVSTNPTVGRLISKLESGLTTHEKLLTREIGSSITEQIQVALGIRKTVISQFFSKVKLACKELDSGIASAAKAVYSPIEKQGGAKLITKSHAEQHAGLALIKQELSTPEMKAKLDFLGFQKSFEQVIEYENQYETLWHQRVNESASAESLPVMRENRREIENALRILIEIIEFHWIDNDTWISDILHDSIRQMIVEMESTIGLRDTLDEKAKAISDSEKSESGK